MYSATSLCSLCPYFRPFPPFCSSTSATMFQNYPLTHSQVGTTRHEQTQWDRATQGHPLGPPAPSIIASSTLAPPNTPPPLEARIYGNWCRTVPIRLQTLPPVMQLVASNEPCPSYDTKSDPAPPYTRLNEQPETLARYLFRYGFRE
jgi:hypothetical protein